MCQRREQRELPHRKMQRLAVREHQPVPDMNLQITDQDDWGPVPRRDAHTNTVANQSDSLVKNV